MAAKNNCVNCGQYAGRSHKCPTTVPAPSAVTVPRHASTLPTSRPADRADVNNRVRRAAGQATVPVTDFNDIRDAYVLVKDFKKWSESENDQPYADMSKVRDAQKLLANTRAWIKNTFVPAVQNEPSVNWRSYSFKPWYPEGVTFQKKEAIIVVNTTDSGHGDMAEYRYGGNTSYREAHVTWKQMERISKTLNLRPIRKPATGQ